MIVDTKITLLQKFEAWRFEPLFQELAIIIKNNCYFLSIDKYFRTTEHWADDKQSKARNSDGKYRQMALVGFDT